ncbi:hypothetical protein LEMLEM_LOCUS22806, partial [Lemmus lemmus]
MLITFTTTKNNLGRRVCLAYMSRSQSIMKEVRTGTQGRSLESRTEAEVMEQGSYWLAPRGLLGLLFYTTQVHLPRGGTAYSGPDPPSSIIYQEM